MRLGGPVFFGDSADPDAWVDAVRAKGYRAALAPVRPGTDDATVRAYRQAAEAADIVIAEVGAWSNPLSSDPAERAQALETCKAALALADSIGARCCVNVTGSRGARWAGPDPKNLTGETFDMIVASVREIVDAVQPESAYYTLEAMQWMYPDSPDSYLRLLGSIDRNRVAVHLDPVNMINSAERYFRNADLVRECFAKLGRYTVSCHAKDVHLDDRSIVHLDEVTPGDGALDYGVFLEELDRLDADTPLILEHLPDEAEYDRAATFIRKVQREGGRQA